MKLKIKPVFLNEISTNVKLLHKALDVLGKPVSKKETDQCKAGEETFKKVSDLLAEFKLPFDIAKIVSEDIAIAIAEILKKKGLTETHRSFTVSGTVKQADGSVKKRQKLLAVDLDLQGVSVYKTIESLTEIRKNQGFEELGETVSDNLGNYSITFFNWQYKRAERKKADVVVYAIDDEDITGLSAMVHADAYSNKGLVRGLDVIVIDRGKKTEYELFIDDLYKFLKENQTTLADIAVSRDQLTFTAQELDVDQEQIDIAATAELLINQERKKLSHQLMYGLGRQHVTLSWQTLFNKQKTELRKAIRKSMDERIIAKHGYKAVNEFIRAIKDCAVKHKLENNEIDAGNNLNNLDFMLSHALPDKSQRVSFVKALGEFEGTGYQEFWDKYLPAQPGFKDNPGLIKKLLYTQQLTLLTGNHQNLVKELQVNKELTSIAPLFNLEKKDWKALIKKTGVPEIIEGTNDEEKINRYVEQIQSVLNLSFPTLRIAKMVAKKELNIKNKKVSNHVASFLSNNKDFDFAGSRIHDFNNSIVEIAGEHSSDVRDELMKIQRVFQVSPSPEAMSVLLEKNLHSAYTIAAIPEKNFIKTYAGDLGGERTAFEVYQKASFIRAKNEMMAMSMMEYTSGAIPKSIAGIEERSRIKKSLEDRLPNWTNLFGSPDICECRHCRSVLSASAYFVELMRFLSQGQAEYEGTPLDILTRRRPDLLHLPLTCENTNTLIPYIDLANEVMEYYTVMADDWENGNTALPEGIQVDMDYFKPYDTGNVTVAELRANPQNVSLEAYRVLSNNDSNHLAVYPFTLPYHHPLDTIRTYCDFLKINRCEALKALNPEPDQTTKKAINAECLGLSPEEYAILTGTKLRVEDGEETRDTTSTHRYFGFAEEADLEELRGVNECLRRSGIAYTELVELIKTRFINPYQNTLDYIEELFSYASLNAGTIYNRLKQLASGTIDAAGDEEIRGALNRYNDARETEITVNDLSQWVDRHFDQLNQVITLYQPLSQCDLDTTQLKTIESIYEGLDESGIAISTWSRIHRFIRLWRKLGWTIHETDLILTALGENDITEHTIYQLNQVTLLQTAAKLPLDQLAVFWGNIDTYGDRSLYKALFLNTTTWEEAFTLIPGQQSHSLQEQNVPLKDHLPVILDTFKITEEDISTIQESGGIIPIEEATLNIQNLSVIYRYVIMANALKMDITGMCKLISLFSMSPFSVLKTEQNKYIDISPGDTYDFYILATSIKDAGFTVPVLDYMFNGHLPADSNLGLDDTTVLETAGTIRDALDFIEQEHPETPVSPLTPDQLSAKLSIIFQPEIVSRFMEILDGTAVFDTSTEDNLDVVIPGSLSAKYTYIKGSGKIFCRGIMTADEQTELKDLDNIDDNFKEAVDRLFEAPRVFIGDYFNIVFTEPSIMNEAISLLLTASPPDQPAHLDETMEEKLGFVYRYALPVIKRKLQRHAAASHIAALTGLSEEAAGLVMGEEVDELIAGLSLKGFSATYFQDSDWTGSQLDGVDETIHFSSGISVSGPREFDNHKSMRWQAYISAPASGDYTLVVDVENTGDIFRLYLDDALILDKATEEDTHSREIEIELNSARMRRLKLEYAKSVDKGGIKLRWKTTSTGLEILPPTAAYPASNLDTFISRVSIFHRAAAFITGFNIDETELNYFIKHKENFSEIDFKALKSEDWKRINSFITLRNAIPQAEARLTDVFALAGMEEIIATLHKATGWEKQTMEFLIDHFNLSRENFKDNRYLLRMLEVIKIVKTSGLPVRTIARLGKAEITFDGLHEIAQSIIKGVKAKYEDAEWLDVLGNLNDKIRENRKLALIDYLLTHPAIREWGALDADGLFEYLLIDVQMSACMDTSRIVQANAAVQMFVNRCLLNLEKEVSPTDIDKDRWAWMKNYRVWEANRKVFLFPENWLEPEWRNDRSEFFKELESYLVQNDITERSVEQGFRNYLTSLNEVANLDVCGMYQENEDDENRTLKYLHVFARTHNTPYKFFYRRWDDSKKWSAWEKVQVDIRTTEDGDNSGVHLIPVVWKKRLFLFWPEFMEKLEPKPTNNQDNMEATGQKTQESLIPDKYWEVRLAWSEYVDGKWSPKQVSKEYSEIKNIPPEFKKSHLSFTTTVNDDTQELKILMWNNQYHSSICYESFILSDIQSRIRVLEVLHVKIIQKFQGKPLSLVIYPICIQKSLQEANYNSNYMKRSKEKFPLSLMDNVYLKKDLSHQLLNANNFENVHNETKLEYPFFFSDENRTYFVTPVDAKIKTRIVLPRLYRITNRNNGRNKSNSHLDYGRDIRTGTNAMLARNAGSHLIDTDTEIISPSLASTQKLVYNIRASFAGSEKILNIEEEIDGKALEFHTFYHPFSSEFVKNLNQGGLEGLMESDSVGLKPGVRDYDTFNNYYDPNFTKGLIQPKPDSEQFKQHTYYKENVCFDPYGANSLYNWELFFHAPLYIATRLSKNGKFEEAMKWFHFIFDPTTDSEETGKSRYWKVPPLKKEITEGIEDLLRKVNQETGPQNPDDDSKSQMTNIIDEWRKHPFDPHRVAANRPVAYMKHVVIKYIENLIAWGDSLFRQFTRESVNEALQVYVIANHVLGPRPRFVPKRGKVKAQTYFSIKDKLDEFSNVLVEMENLLPYSSGVRVRDTSSGSNLLGIGSALYFCIPFNDRLIEYWDTVADRLFKIRHCQDIDGVERKLALFAPPISPEALIQAASQGLSLGSILAALSSPPPLYRFSYLVQKANEFCGDVKALGSALLSALEKKDAEELGRLRASHETGMLELVTAIKERQVLEAKASKENLQKVRETAAFRLQHYIDLLGNEDVSIPDEPEIDAELSADSQLPPDTNIQKIETDVDESLVESGESGVKLIPREKGELDSSHDAHVLQIVAGTLESIASIVHSFPTVGADGKPLGVGTTMTWGGTHLGNALNSTAKHFHLIASQYSYEATMASKMASYIRREQDWTLQANLAAKEIIQLDKQITSANIRIQVAEKELENHKQQIENAKEVELFIKDKFTNQELYQWMKEQLFDVYKQSYNLAFDMAQKAEQAYRYERGIETSSFIRYGHWDNSKQGLVAGEKLQLALRQLEKSYLENNRRELELTKNISVALLNPLALIELRETGKCYLSLPEELFDFDFQGHYFRRIKSVSLSIPCIAGPHTTVNCSLRLLKNSIRTRTTMGENGYKHNQEEGGLWTDDTRFRTSNVPVTSIATSRGQNDTGMFDFNFRDERYLPFEGAGVVSDWLIELGGANFSADDNNEMLRQFDYTTITDVIIHLNYTARENGGQFRQNAQAHIKEFILNGAGQADSPFMRMFSMKHEFPSQWHSFLHPSTQNGEQTLNVTIGKERFPYFTQDGTIDVTEIDVFANVTNDKNDYHLALSGSDTASQMAPKSGYGKLLSITIGNENGSGLTLSDIDISDEISLKFGHGSNTTLSTFPVKADELVDVYLVIHYNVNFKNTGS